MAIKIDLECPLKYSAEFYIQIIYKAFKFDINAENVEFATFVKSLDDFTLVNKIIGMHEKRIYDCNWVRYTSSREGRSIELKMRYEDTSNHANDIVLFSGEFHLKNNHLVLKKINEFNEAFYKYSEAFDQSKKEMVPNDIELSFKEKPKIKNNDLLPVGLEVWWSSDKGDGDGYDSEMNVTYKQYKALSEYDGEELCDITIPGLTKYLKQVYTDEINILKENSEAGFEETDKDGATFDDYWDSLNAGVRINDDFDKLE